jgi:hypothetical protein
MSREQMRGDGGARRRGIDLRRVRHEMTDRHLSEVTVTVFSAAIPIVTLSSAPILAS